MSDFSVKQFANSPRVNQILHRVNSLICTRTKNCNHLRSHWRDIMALDYSRLGLENKFLENKSGRIFCVRQVYLPTNLGACKPTFYTFILIHHIWGETVLWGAVFIIQTSDRMLYFTILQNKFHSLSIQDDGSTRGLLARSLKKFSKSPIRPAGSHFWQQPNEWTIIELPLNIIKNLLCLFFI